MDEIKSHFVFNRSQRNGILLLLLIITGFIIVNYYIDFSDENVMDTNSEEIVAIQKELDSLRAIEIASRKPKIFPFNPNFITDFKGYTLGMSTEEIDRLLTFRSENKWINSTEDFKKVTMVSDSLLNIISPYFKFPEWVTNPKPKNNFLTNSFKPKAYEQKIDLNKASMEQLQNVNGIGEAYSNRIINYREKLGGFTADSQLYEVYGLDNQVINRILNDFTVKTPKEIIKMNINTISASDIATIPGISFDQAKKIWEYRMLRGRISDFSELEKIEGLTERKLIGIQLYLTLE